MTRFRPALAVALLAALAFAALLVRPSVQPAARARFAPAGGLPLRFEANLGQTDPGVRFLARGPGYTLFLAEDEAVLRAPADVVRLRWRGGSATARIEGLEELPGRSNYFIGEPDGWVTGAPAYARVAYRDVYPGTDLVFYGVDGGLEYDFVLAPGADPRAITLEFEGARSVRLDADGNLIVQGDSGALRQRPPNVYQLVDGGRRGVAGGYELRGEGRIGFTLGDYDPSLPLVIDPVLDYSSYLGGGGTEFADAIAVDSAGAAYLTGFTSSSDFPRRNEFQRNRLGDNDVFVTKVAPDGRQVLYSTYLGGRDRERGLGIAVDSAGAAYITGETSSIDFPRTANVFQRIYGGGARDAFVAKLSPAGDELIYSTFIGDADEDWGRDIAVDATGLAHVVGNTKSPAFPTTQGALQRVFGGDEDIFIVQLGRVGKFLLFSTFLGAEGRDNGHAIALDRNGNVCLTGFTRSRKFPVSTLAFQRSRAGDEDAFFTKINSTASAILLSTYLGGRRADFGNDIAIDDLGQVYLGGFTRSDDFPVRLPGLDTTFGGEGDGWVARLIPNTTFPARSSYLGGEKEDTVNGLAVGANRFLAVTGHTKSEDFPVVDGALQDRLQDGGGDAFYSRFNEDMTRLIDSTYVGGTGVDEGFAIALDPRQAAYLAGRTAADEFPTTADSFQPSRRGGDEAFVLKIIENFEVTTVSGASFAAGLPVGPESIASAFGRRLARGSEAAATTPLPVELAGARVFVTDSAGFVRSAGLFFASEGQINFEIPPGTAEGTARVSVTVDGLETAVGTVEIRNAAPGIFTANASGEGPPAATVVTVLSNGERREAVVFSDAPVGRRTPVSINLGGPGAETVLVLFLSGVRHASTVRAEVAGEETAVLFSGAQPDFVALDQVNVRLDRKLFGRGLIEVVIIADGRRSNTVVIRIQ